MMCRKALQQNRNDMRTTAKVQLHNGILCIVYSTK